jgi:thymidylate synthase ThyX
MRMVFQKIKRVKSLGIQQTYDLTVTHPEHAFCASSFVVHNCNGESARYKEIKDNSSLIPSDWPIDIQNALKTHCLASNELYHATLARLTPILGRARAKESARFFLPYANQLTLDVSFNFRSFVHFLGLRNKPTAQKEIRDIAANMLDLVKSIEGNPFKATLEAFKL